MKATSLVNAKLIVCRHPKAEIAIYVDARMSEPESRNYSRIKVPTGCDYVEIRFDDPVPQQIFGWGMLVDGHKIFLVRFERPVTLNQFGTFVVDLRGIL